MNEALFASIHVDTSGSADDTARVVAAIVDGSAVGRHVECSWARIVIDDDYGDFEICEQDMDDFLGWRTLLEVMPHDAASEEVVVSKTRDLTSALVIRGWRVVVQCDHADQLAGVPTR